MRSRIVDRLVGMTRRILVTGRFRTACIGTGGLGWRPGAARRPSGSSILTIPENDYPPPSGEADPWLVVNAAAYTAVDAAENQTRRRALRRQFVMAQRRLALACVPMPIFR